MRCIKDAADATGRIQQLHSSDRLCRSIAHTRSNQSLGVELRHRSGGGAFFSLHQVVSGEGDKQEGAG